MAKKSMVLKQQASRSSPAELTTAARSAAVRTLTCVISVSAVSASRELAIYKGQIPGVRKASW